MFGLVLFALELFAFFPLARWGQRPCDYHDTWIVATHGIMIQEQFDFTFKLHLSCGTVCGSHCRRQCTPMHQVSNGFTVRVFLSSATHSQPSGERIVAIFISRTEVRAYAMVVRVRAQSPIPRGLWKMGRLRSEQLLIRLFRWHSESRHEQEVLRYGPW